MAKTLEDVGGLAGGAVLKEFLSGGVDDSGRSRDQILREAQGVKGENFTRYMGQASSLLVDGTVYYLLTPFLAGDVVTNIIPSVATGGATVTLAKVGLYSAAGVKLASSADLGQDWASLGPRVNALSAPFTIPSP